MWFTGSSNTNHCCRFDSKTNRNILTILPIPDTESSISAFTFRGSVRRTALCCEPAIFCALSRALLRAVFGLLSEHLFNRDCCVQQQLLATQPALSKLVPHALLSTILTFEHIAVVVVVTIF